MLIKHFVSKNCCWRNRTVAGKNKEAEVLGWKKTGNQEFPPSQPQPFETLIELICTLINAHLKKKRGNKKVKTLGYSCFSLGGLWLQATEISRKEMMIPKRQAGFC